MLDWRWKTFPELSLDELYAVLALRLEVFVVEQRSLYQDADGLDRECHHLLGTFQEEGSALAAYLRVLPPGLKFEEVSIGRVVVAPRARGQNLGRELMTRALAFVEERYPGQRIRISAQHYLLAFYEGLGFRARGDVYDEDGVPHIDMLR
ncbi:GNAT family N-acetyltransferase [Myxococcaceae bacterium GXIMD 01537]